MAKKTDQLASDLETDETGGMLSGLLAEEDDLDRRALWRIGSWGFAAVGAVVLAVMANQSGIGIKRDQVAAADISRQAQQIQLVARETQNETRRLSSAIDTLNTDRDRLYSRVTGLEQGLDSVTGAIARQGPVAAVDPQANQNLVPAPSVAPVATTQPPTTAVDKPISKSNNGAAPGAIAALPKIESVRPEATKADTAKSDEAKSDHAKSDPPKADPAKAELTKSDRAKLESSKPDPAKSDTPKGDPAKDTPKDTGKDAAKAEAEKPSPATPLIASQSMMAPPDPAATKLTEPTKPVSVVATSPIPEVVASAPAATDEEADEATMVPPKAARRTEFGVDLGSANSVAGLRALWLGLLKSRSNAPLKELRPIIVVKESTKGLGMQLRLVAGPLHDAGAAAKICAAMTENNRTCETSVFDGQRLSLKPEDQPAPAATKPAPRKRTAAPPKRAAVAEEPKKPEPAPASSASTTLTSWFGRRNTQ